MVEPSIGEQELALLRHIADHGSVTVGEAADAFGAPRGLARSTVLTMMERLRLKGHLGRRMADGVYRYRARASSADLLKSAVQRFVERSLDGSVSPFWRICPMRAGSPTTSCASSRRSWRGCTPAGERTGDES